MSGFGLFYPRLQKAETPVERALRGAREKHRFLIVEFGADWCSDCRALARQFEASPTREYLQKHFDVLSVDVGEFDRNLDVVRSIGGNISHGIPAAVIFGPDGNRIGATDRGELASAGKYGQRQILDFLHGVVEQRLITKPSSGYSPQVLSYCVPIQDRW
jgi:thioredoxin 1